MLGWMAYCMPITYTVLKASAQMRHEMPVTPVGIAIKAMFGTHANDSLVRAVYPEPGLHEL